MSALRSSRPRPGYPCSQQDLYSVVETGWNSYNEHLLLFENLSTRYTATTGTDQLATLQLVRNLPDEYKRDETHKSLRLQLVSLSEDCIAKWHFLSGYIRDGFTEEEYDGKRLAAGHAYLRGAEQQDWEQVIALMQSGVSFAGANTAALTTGGMPPTFLAELTQLRDDVQARHQEFIQSEEQAKVLTDQKINANNKLFKDLMSMFEDGKRLFRQDAAIREQFTLDRVLDLIRGGSSGTGVAATEIKIGVLVYDEGTGIAISGAVLIVLNTPNGMPITVVTDDDGIANTTIGGFVANETVVLQGEVSASGYEPGEGFFEMTAGNAYSFDVAMTPSVV